MKWIKKLFKKEEKKPYTKSDCRELMINLLNNGVSHLDTGVNVFTSEVDDYSISFRIDNYIGYIIENNHKRLIMDTFVPTEEIINAFGWIKYKDIWMTKAEMREQRIDKILNSD